MSPPLAIGLVLVLLLSPSSALISALHRSTGIDRLASSSNLFSSLSPLEKVFSGPAPTARPAEAATAEKRLLFIGVFSAPQYRSRRDEIRKSWMLQSAITAHDAEVVAKFVVGTPRAGSHREKLLAAEMMNHSDILQLPVEERYDGLVEKTTSFLRWFTFNGSASYVMKVDDDTFPDLRKLQPILHQKKKRHRKYLYAGGMLMHNRVLTVGKWAQSTLVYDKEFYPPYASGPGYVLGADLVRLLFDTHFALHSSRPKLANEDTNLGVWVSHENETTPIDYTNLQHEQDGCRQGVVLAMNLRPGTMRCMYLRMVAGSRNICCGGAIGSWQQRNMAKT
eukprot:TRINITY_DN31278_c0_g1_i1.p1 TRINITY_DN31278_c0_g1~~TRINITY_DN31278_c0_g1_i1.p1  ORF type:complete len:336 (-),score=51.91 TRINITY_DN31278_c0_g1_i1:134-1141(-)